MTRAWSIDDRDGLRVVRCLPWLGLPGLAHGFSTRDADGGADFDLGGPDRGDPEIERRRRAFCRASGLAGKTPAILRQVHGSRLVRIAETVDAAPQADGVIATRADPVGTVPAVRTADCVPILMMDREGAAIAAVHGGWRGAAAGIARRAVSALQRLGADPLRLAIALGPAIGRCCYRVGPEVAGEVATACGVGPEAISDPAQGGGRLLDLHAAHRLQLEAAGIPASSILTAPWCTACSPEWFFSYRRDGPGAGRQMACVGWTGLA